MLIGTSMTQKRSNRGDINGEKERAEYGALRHSRFRDSVQRIVTDFDVL